MNYSYKDDQGNVHTIKCNDQEVYAIAKSLDLNPNNPHDLLEAQYVWACDHDKITDSDQQELNQKAAGVANARVNKGRRKVNRKPNETKIKIINELAAFLLNESYSDVEIVNKQGEVQFSVGDKSFSVKLTQHRK